MSLRSLFTIFMLLAAGATCAQIAPPQFVEGMHYQRITSSLSGASGNRVEVIEFFSSGCGACNSFQPAVDKWKPSLASDVDFKYTPVTFQPLFALLARARFAAQALGDGVKSHQAIFDSIFKNKTQYQTIEQLADFYANRGLDRSKFLAASQSFGVEAKLKQVESAMRRYQIISVPSMVVAGKYRVTPVVPGDFASMLPVVDFLIAKERAERLARDTP